MLQWTHEVYAGKKVLCDTEMAGRRVFLRVDYNVPMESGRITDDTKIRKSLPTIEFLMRKGVKSIVIGTHLGRPECDEDSENKPHDGGVLPLLERLNELIGESSRLREERGKELGFGCEFKLIFAQREEITYPWVMIQNLRTFKCEQDKEDVKCREFFDKFILANCDLMVSDGFGVLHRKDYSVVGIPLEKVAGLLVDSEVQALSLLLGNFPVPEEKSPSLASASKSHLNLPAEIASARQAKVSASGQKPIDFLIIGGCKLSDKISLVKRLSGIAANIFLGGRLSVPFELRDKKSGIVEIIEDMSASGTSLWLPTDYILEKNGALEVAESSKITAKNEQFIRDVGPDTERRLEEAIGQVERVFWNGTLGVIESAAYRHGTDSLIRSIGKRREKLLREGKHPMMAVGGGDTAGYVHRSREKELSFDLLFTGGGATLEALEGKVLPGIDALSDRM